VLHPLNHSLDKAVPPNHIYRINTGAPLPRGADAVIMVEDTSLVSELDDAADIGSLGEERQVQTLVAVNAGENVRQPGSDVRQGDKIFDCGDALGNTGGDIGALAFIGRRKVFNLI
jgi:gephyrin